MILTSIVSVGVGLGIAAKLDWLEPSVAQNVTAPLAVPAANPPPPSPAGFYPTSFSTLAKQVQPAVVNISTSKTLKYRRASPFDFYGRFYDNGTATLRHQNSLGSGFIIDKDGFILTNNHVVSGADEIQVTLSDGRVFAATIVGADPNIDVAVIKIDAKGALPAITLGNSDQLETGEWVVAIGNPFGLTHTVTAGIVSAKGRVIGAGPYDDFIQTDASINPGNSGGPLFNLRGEVVGINTAIIASGQGIGFATPINMAKTVLPQLMKGSHVQRGYLGIGLEEITPETASALGLDRPQGALVANVFDRSPAYQAGIQAGDLILSFNGKAIDNAHDLPVWISQSPIGTLADIQVLRGKDKKSFQVKLASLDDASHQIAQSSGGAGAKTPLGVFVRDVNPVESQQQGLQPGKGVTVTEIQGGSPAESIGIQPGDVILEINNKAVTGSQDFVSNTESLQRGQTVRMFVKRGPMTSFFAFRM